MVHTDSWIIEGRKLIECVCGRAEEGRREGEVECHTDFDSSISPDFKVCEGEKRKQRQSSHSTG